jgi:hypothetical protein
VAALHALGTISIRLAHQSTAEQDRLPFSQGLFEQLMAGLVKLLVDKLEPVRAAAAYNWGLMRMASVQSVWDWPESDVVSVTLEEPQ